MKHASQFLLSIKCYNIHCSTSIALGSPITKYRGCGKVGGKICEIIVDFKPLSHLYIYVQGMLRIKSFEYSFLVSCNFDAKKQLEISTKPTLRSRNLCYKNIIFRLRTGSSEIFICCRLINTTFFFLNYQNPLYRTM